MFLEISGRQTGKTTRLADRASDELILNIDDPSYNICIVGPSHNTMTHTRDMIISMFNQKIGGVNNQFRTVLMNRLNRKIKMSATMKPRRGYTLIGEVTKFYIDEFAFISSDELEIVDNAYYCTTPNGNHQFTTLLLNYCRQRQISVESYDVSRRLRNNFMFNREVDEFDNWCIEHELEMYRHPFEKNGFIEKYIKRHKFNGRNR